MERLLTYGRSIFMLIQFIRKTGKNLLDDICTKFNETLMKIGTIQFKIKIPDVKDINSLRQN